MNPLGELANKTWLYLEDLLKDIDNNENECEIFVNDTRIFFKERLLIYEKQRNELENHIKKLSEQMYQLYDELDLPRITFDNNNQQEKLTLKEKRKLINDKIDQLKNLIFERDKELIHLKQLINHKIKFIGNIQINIDEIKSTIQANSILLDLKNQLNKLKENIENIFKKIHLINSDLSSNYEKLVNSYISVNDENEFLWLNNNSSLNGYLLYLKLQTEYEKLQEMILNEVLQLRQELNQKEPIPSIDLQEELINLRLRKRYLSLLSKYPHKLTSESSLDEIRQTYEQLTLSLCVQAREKLKNLWNQLDVPDNQRFIPKTKNNHDDYLSMMDEIHRLEIYVESIRPILIKIQKREWYKREMVEFEKRAANPARLRGSSTQLLKEEKFRKDLSREFPKLTDDLHHMVAEWEETSGKKLIYGGEPYLETMNKEKLSVDFDLLHLRLLTKCQLLVQTIPDETNNEDNHYHPHHHQRPPRSSLNINHNRSTSTPPLSRNRNSTSKIPTMNFVNSNRKINHK